MERSIYKESKGGHGKDKRQFRNATQGLTKDQKRRLHNEVSGKRLNYKELVEEVAGFT